MVSCPKGCPRQLADAAELYRHLRDYHRVGEADAKRLSGINSGWFEQKQPTPDGNKAIEHQIAAKKAEIAENAPLKVPIVKIERKPEVIVAPGWVPSEKGYKFNKTVHEEHTIENVRQYILRGEISGNHGSLVLWIYDKDVGELREKQDKASILEAKLKAYVVSDPEYMPIASELHDLLYQIRVLKRETEADVNHDTKLEDSYNGSDAFGDNPYEKWVSEFMVKSNTEAARVEEGLKKKDPIRL